MRTKKSGTVSPAKGRGRPRKVQCTALIPLDTDKIRKEMLKVYKRRKKALEKLEAELQQFRENDEPEFQKFMAQHFGTQRSRLRELHEIIGLHMSRLNKISHMARARRMQPGKYCFHLQSQVTPENDFWAVLDNDTQQFIEEQRRINEEYERSCREYDEDDDDFDDDFDDDDEDFIDDDFEEDFEDHDGGGERKSLFDRLFSELFPQEKDSGREAALKKLYRELCFRYHPDKIGGHDAKTRLLWLSIQEAYAARDLDRLRAINAGLEIESGKTTAACSEIGNMILDVECTIRMTRGNVRQQKRSPYWGFTTWTEKRRRQAEKELSESFRQDIEEAAFQVELYADELERLRNSYRPPAKKRRYDQETQPDLFDLNFN